MLLVKKSYAGTRTTSSLSGIQSRGRLQTVTRLGFFNTSIFLEEPPALFLTCSQTTWFSITQKR